MLNQSHLKANENHALKYEINLVLKSLKRSINIY